MDIANGVELLSWHNCRLLVVCSTAATRCLQSLIWFVPIVGGAIEPYLCTGFILVFNGQSVGLEGMYYHRLYGHPCNRNCGISCTGADYSLPLPCD